MGRPLDQPLASERPRLWLEAAEGRRFHPLHVPASEPVGLDERSAKVQIEARSRDNQAVERNENTNPPPGTAGGALEPFTVTLRFMRTSLRIVLVSRKDFSQTSTTISFLFLSDDDIIFEDFARQRLIGAKDEKEEDEEPVNSPNPDDR